MTAPVSHGYPDWNRVVAQADTLLLGAAFDPTLADPTDYDLGFVGNYPAIGVTFGVTVQTHVFQMGFFGTPLFQDEFGTYSFRVSTTAALVQRSIPVLGPYLRLRIDPEALGGGPLHLAFVSSSPGSFVPNGSEPLNSVLISTTATAVGVGATVTSNATRVWPGEATWTVTSASTAYRAVLQALGVGGAWTTIDSIQGAGLPSQSHKVFLPAAPIRVQFTNNGGAAANHDTYVVSRFIEAGS